jgi:3-hydroxyisobutyrate dehydrogenase-like beta-hydroxyacid dehydrogenase
MAVHIAERFETTVWNRTIERARDFAGSTGAAVADTPTALVDAADVVVTCLPTSVEVLEARRLHLG